MHRAARRGLRSCSCVGGWQPPRHTTLHWRQPCGRVWGAAPMTQPMNGNHNNDSENKDTSRQVTMFIQAHKGQTICAASSTGSSSSSFFNNGSILGDLNEFKTRDLQWNECIEGEGLRSLVWCNSRSTELSYNTFFT